MFKKDGFKDNYWKLITKVLGDDWEIELGVKDDEYYFTKTKNNSYYENINYNKYYFIYVFRKNDYTELILQMSKNNEFTDFLEQVKKLEVK